MLFQKLLCPWLVESPRGGDGGRVCRWVWSAGWARSGSMPAPLPPPHTAAGGSSTPAPPLSSPLSSPQTLPTAPALPLSSPPPPRLLPPHVPSAHSRSLPGSTAALGSSPHHPPALQTSTA